MSDIFANLNVEGTFLLVWGVLMLAVTIFWIAMLVDAIRREFSDSNMKLIWVLVLLFTHSVGALIYYFVGRSMGRLR